MTLLHLVGNALLACSLWLGGRFVGDGIHSVGHGLKPFTLANKTIDKLVDKLDNTKLAESTTKFVDEHTNLVDKLADKVENTTLVDKLVDKLADKVENTTLVDKLVDKLADKVENTTLVDKLDNTKLVESATKFVDTISKLVWGLYVIGAVWVVRQVPFMEMGRALSGLLGSRTPRRDVSDIADEIAYDAADEPGGPLGG